MSSAMKESSILKAISDAIEEYEEKSTKTDRPVRE